MTDNPNNHGAAAAALAGDPTNGTPAPTNGGTPPVNGGTPPAEKFWYSDLPPELQGNLEKKGWNNPKALPEVVSKYFELEKQYRAGDKVMLPKDEADKEGYDALYNRLGRPESPDKYAFPEGVDGELAKALAPKLHELGISQKQAQGLATIDLERAAAAQEAERVRVVNDQNAADQALRSEWGQKYNENMEFARRAMRGLGLNLDQGFIPMAAAIGSKNALKLLHLAGLNTREDNAASVGDAAAGFGMTPNRAKAELQEKGADLLRRARAGDKGAVAHWQRLQKAIAGDGMVEI
jgi:hypothetical protein